MAYSLTDPANFDPNHLDGVLALSNLLGHDESVRVYPGQMIIFGNPDNHQLSFVHGTPDTTTLTSAITIQHKRMRRGILERSGIPVPRGATFSMARGLEQAKNFAKKIGFPVVIKPSRGDSGLYNFTNLTSLQEVDQAIEKMKVPTYERSDVFHSSYTPMELAKPRSENGSIIVPGSYRIIVEKQLPGQLVRFLVYNGKVLSAVSCEGSLTDGTLASAQDVLSVTHPHILRIVERAFAALPHIGIAAIDIVTSNVESPQGERDAHVVDFHARPFLWVQAKSSSALAQSLSKTITSRYLISQGHHVYPTAGETRVFIRAFSLPSARSTQEVLVDIAQHFDVLYSPMSHSDLNGTTEGILEGANFKVSSLIDSITNKRYESAPAGLIEVSRA